MQTQNQITSFGTTADGTQVNQITLTQGGLSCQILTYGGIVRTLTVPDRDGNKVDVVLGFDTLQDYMSQDKYIGALVGRCANRIAGGQFMLHGQAYPLYVNNGPNHLHGGRVGFDAQVWTVEEMGPAYVTLSLSSPDGQEGYPGDLTVQATCTLEADGLRMAYWAKSTQDTICNLTNHSYFNLSGHHTGPALNHQLQLFAQFYTPADATSIPTGEVVPVEGTPMDFRQLTPVGTRIEEDFTQLVQAKGYDHNWVIDGLSGTLRPAAVLYSPDTGIVMEIQTTMPGIQFYAGNYLEGCPAGKGGAHYGNRWGLALETQYFPDAIHHPNFPSPVLKAGEEYSHQTFYRFHIQ